jgi:hypothetical protein
LLLGYTVYWLDHIFHPRPQKHTTCMMVMVMVMIANHYDNLIKLIINL